MAQAIVLYCDPHLVEDGVKEEAETVTWKGKSCELCAECLGTYVVSELDEVMEKYGRKADNGQVKRAKKPVEAVAAVEPAYYDENDLTCPHGCNKGQPFKSLQGKRMHMTMRHKVEGV